MKVLMMMTASQFDIITFFKEHISLKDYKTKIVNIAKCFVA